MTNSSDSHWVVLKFGGTSVSSVSNWKNVAAVVRARLDEGLRPVVVHSALSQRASRVTRPQHDNRTALAPQGIVP